MAKQIPRGSLVVMVGILLFISACLCQPIAGDQDEPNSNEIDQWVLEKRPFCNAFAGK